jgi:arylsulfatase A-like enzyme
MQKRQRLTDWHRRELLIQMLYAKRPIQWLNHASILSALYPFNHGLRSQHCKKKLNPDSLFLLRNLKETHRMLCFSQLQFSDESYGYDIWDYYEKAKLLNIKRRLAYRSEKPFFAFVHRWQVHTPYRIRLAESTWERIGELLEIVVKNDYVFIPRVDGQIFGGDMKKVAKIRHYLSTDNKDIRESLLQGYSKAVTRVDRFVNRLLGILDSAGKLSNTVVALTSDHGESFNNYDEASRFPDGYEHGYCLYDNVIKVPIIIRDFTSPRPVGVVLQRQVQLVDLMPTLCGSVGMGSLLDNAVTNGTKMPLCAEEAQLDTQGDVPYAYSEAMGPGSDRTRNKPQLVCIRTNNNYKIIANRKEGTYSLFDCNNSETEDLKERQPHRFEELTKKLEKLIADSTILEHKPKRRMSKAEEESVERRLKELGYL